MKYIWLRTFTEEDRSAIDGLRAACLMRDGRLPLLNLPDRPEECDGCLTAVSDDAAIRGLLTCLYSEKTVEVCILVHPEFRGRGIGTELLHRLIISTKKVPVFPVAADDANAMAFLAYIGKREIFREMLKTLTRETCSDEKTGVASPEKKKLRVTCKACPMPADEMTDEKTITDVNVTCKACSQSAADVAVPADRQLKYTLYLGAIPVGRCLVTGGCVSGVWIRGIFRKRGYGSFLLRTVIRHQFSLGRRSLFLHVTNTNRAACALYRKYGFEVTEEVVYWV